MHLDLINSQPVVRVALEEAAEQVSGFRAEARQDFNVLLCDAAQNLMSAFVALHGLLFEGVDATDHFIGKHAKTPPINGKAMAFSLDHFWREILWSAAESVCHAILWLLDFAQTEIGQLEVAFRV